MNPNFQQSTFSRHFFLPPSAPTDISASHDIELSQKMRSDRFCASRSHTLCILCAIAASLHANSIERFLPNFLSAEGPNSWTCWFTRKSCITKLLDQANLFFCAFLIGYFRTPALMQAHHISTVPTVAYMFGFCKVIVKLHSDFTTTSERESAWESSLKSRLLTGHISHRSASPQLKNWSIYRICQGTYL